MSGRNYFPREHLKQHWFWLAAFAVVLTNALMIALDGWQAPQLKEFGVLFDFAVLIPVLYLICYRARGQQAVIRALAFACLGIWIASHIVPDQHHSLISELGVFRYVGLAVLVVIQIRIGIELFRIALSSAEDDVSQAVQQKAEQEGMPTWVAKLMAFEARIWSKAWAFMRSFFKS